MNNQNLDKPLVEDLQSKNIDIDLACSVLDRLQKGDYSNTSVTVGEIPKPDDPAIIDCTGPLSYSCSRNKLAKVFAHLEIGIDAEQFGLIDGPDIGFDNRGLNRLGNSLAPYLSYGILNGGSATSYADEKKNRGFHSEIYDYYSKFFREIIDKDKGRPKGLHPHLFSTTDRLARSFSNSKCGAFCTVPGIPDMQRVWTHFCQCIR